MKKTQIIPITIVITIALIAILMVGVAWWYTSNKEGVNTNQSTTKNPNKNGDINQNQNLNVNKATELFFEISDCIETEPKGYGYGVKSERWLDSVLEVRAFEELNCCTEKYGDYDIEGDLIKFYINEFGEQCDCQCDYDVEFNLGHLEKKGYEVMTFSQYLGSSKSCYEELEKILLEIKTKKECQKDEDCRIIACECYNNDALKLKESYEEKGCEIPIYSCIDPDCVCLNDQCIDASNTNTSLSKNKYCQQDSDCGLLVCSGCFSKEYIKTAPADLSCRTYEGYECRCISNSCTIDISYIRNNYCGKTYGDDPSTINTIIGCEYGYTLQRDNKTSVVLDLDGNFLKEGDKCSGAGCSADFNLGACVATNACWYK